MIEFDSLDALRAFVGRSASSEPLVVDQSMIDGFADITHDHQWLHVDRERAAQESPYRTTIAHGLLTLSMITAGYNQCFAFPNRKMAVNYGFDRVRFTGPVPSGARLSTRYTLKAFEPQREGEARCTWQVEMRVEGAERPAMVADWLVQLRY